MSSAVKYKQTQVPRQPNEQSRLKVIHGPDRGCVFVITSMRAIVGRGEECDVQLTDLKSSRKHAEISLSGGTWQVRDLGSANGIVVNQVNSRGAALKSGDVLVVGETAFEFLASEVGTMVLVAPPKSVAQIHSEQDVYNNHKKTLNGLNHKNDKSLFKNPVVLIALATAAWFFFFMDGPSTVKNVVKKRTQHNESRDLASILEKDLDSPETDRAANMFFKAGFREYREKNYLRAKVNFETVLQMVPTHSLATLYLQNCDKSIQEEVKSHLQFGARSRSSGKNKEARSHYEAVMRLLYRDQTNPSYIEAKERIEKMDLSQKVGGS